MVDLIKSPGRPHLRQYVSDCRSSKCRRFGDSLAEDATPRANLTHRYPDRALFLVSPVCAAYCRF